MPLWQILHKSPISEGKLSFDVVFGFQVWPDNRAPETVDLLLAPHSASLQK
jgi:hypothetical protein